MQLNLMNNTNELSYRIGRRPGKQGPRPQRKNLSGAVESSEATNSSIHLNGHLNGIMPTTSPPNSVKTQKRTRIRWTREEYKEVMYAHYSAIEIPSGASHTKKSYEIWRKRMKDYPRNLDEKKVANMRRNIIKEKRLTKAELEEIEGQSQHR